MTETNTGQTQEELSEKPTKTEIKKMKETTVLAALINFYVDTYGIPDKRLTRNSEELTEKMESFINEKDEQQLRDILLDTIKKQATKVNKML